MIQPEELRMGNFIKNTEEYWNSLSDEDKYYDKDKYMKILLPSSKGFYYNSIDNESYQWKISEHDKAGYCDYDVCEPIPLTEEWLIMFNLPHRELMPQANVCKYSIRNDFEIFCHMDESGNCLFYAACPNGYDFFIIKCNTVHGFQQIYSILNPHEKLTIK